MAKEIVNENRFTFWQSYYDTIRYLPDDNVRLRCYEGLLDYMFQNKELPLPQEDPEVYGPLHGMKISLDKNKTYIKDIENKDLQGSYIKEKYDSIEERDAAIALYMRDLYNQRKDTLKPGQEPVKSKEIAGAFGITDGAIRKRPVWEHRTKVYSGEWFDKKENKGDIKISASDF